MKTTNCNLLKMIWPVIIVITTQMNLIASSDCTTCKSSEGANSGMKSSDNVVSNSASSDIAPSFPGGTLALKKYINKTVQYSEQAQQAGVTGTIYVSFSVNGDGTINDVHLLNSLGYGLDEEVLRVVSSMPTWSPGLLNGVPVNSAFVLPFKFSIR